MKKSFGIQLFLIALMLVVLFYFGVQIYNYYADPFSTTLAYGYKVEDTIEAAGLVVRTEQVLPDESSRFLLLDRKEGERVSAGGRVAAVYADQPSLDRKEQMDALETRLEQLRFARAATLGVEVSARLDAQILQGVRDFRSALAAGRLERAQEQGQSLKTLVLKRDYTPADADTLEREIAQAEQQLEELSTASAGAVRYVSAPLSGIYSAVVDGFETVLTPETMKDLTPSEITALRPDGSVHSSVGKLILGDRWYYAAAVSTEEARTMRRTEEEGGALKLRFSKGLERDFPVKLESVGEEENGRVTVIFRGETYLPEVTLLRRQNALVITSVQEGLRVPRESLRMGVWTTEKTVNGKKEQVQETVTGLYCVVGATARFKPVEVLYSGDRFLLVRSTYPEGAERLWLRAGDEVIVQARNLFDGKVVA